MKERLKSIIISILTWQSKVVLDKHSPKIIAITGSLGKTGTKDLVAAAISTKYTVRKSPKSFNSEFGIPLTILGLDNGWNNPIIWIKNIILGFYIVFFKRDYEEVLVLEVGADKPGDIEQVASWLNADIVIITIVPEVPVHVEFYPTAQAVLVEKSNLIKSIKDGGLLITGTDELVSTLENPNGRKSIARYDSAEIMYNDGLPVGMEFVINNKTVRFDGVLGEHMGLAITFAIMVANELGVDKYEAIKAIEDMHRTPGRMRILSGKNGSVIIDDSYNSSPTALKSALEMLGKLETNGKKIAVIGDMKELGEHSDKEHRRAGLQTAHIVDELYTIGTQSKKLAQSAINEGLRDDNVHIYNTDKAVDVGIELKSRLGSGDIVLIKGSQGKLRLERVVREIMHNDSEAKDLLVRQEDQWLKR